MGNANRLVQDSNSVRRVHFFDDNRCTTRTSIIKDLGNVKILKKDKIHKNKTKKKPSVVPTAFEFGNGYFK